MNFLVTCVGKLNGVEGTDGDHQNNLVKDKKPTRLEVEIPEVVAQEGKFALKQSQYAITSWEVLI